MTTSDIPEIRPKRAPRAPSDLARNGRGRAFWKTITGQFESDPTELEVLKEACRLLDLVDRLRSEADSRPVTGEDGKISPVLVELRQVRQQLRRHLTSLALPVDEDVELAPEVRALRTRQARKAASARWS